MGAPLEVADDLSTLPLTQFRDQPIVKATNFEKRHELGIHLDQLLKKRSDLLGTRTDLSAQDRVSIFVADTNGDLLAVLVNCQVQHLWVLLGGTVGEPTRLRRDSSNQENLLHFESDASFIESNLLHEALSVRRVGEKDV